MEDDTAYTLTLWRVKEGREEEFVEAWKGLSDYFLDLPNAPGTGTQVRSVEDPPLFYSFSPWRSIEDIRRMRSDPRTPEMIGKLAALCEEAKPGTFRPVVTAAQLRDPDGRTNFRKFVFQSLSGNCERTPF